MITPINLLSHHKWLFGASAIVVAAVLVALLWPPRASAQTPRSPVQLICTVKAPKGVTLPFSQARACEHLRRDMARHFGREVVLGTRPLSRHAKAWVVTIEIRLPASLVAHVEHQAGSRLRKLPEMAVDVTGRELRFADLQTLSRSVLAAMSDA